MTKKMKRIFIIDTKIVTRTTVVKGRLEEKLPNGDIRLEIFSGVYDTIPADDVRMIAPVPLSDSANDAARRQIEAAEGQ